MNRSKVIIIDDENKIVELIKTLIHWDAMPLELVGTANNGIGGLELIEDKNPDIVILDMKMPGFNGIELISRVKEQYPTMYFIIISGYRRFEYAQSAIKYGVEDYLLKPVEEVELNSTLKNVIEKIESRILDDSKNELYSTVEAKQFENKFFNDLLSNNISKDITVQTLKQKYRIDIPFKNYEYVLFRNDLDVTEFNENQDLLLKEKTEAIIKKQLNVNNLKYYTLFNEEGVFLLLNYSCDYELSIRDSLFSIIEALYGIRDLFPNLKSSAARSGCFIDIGEFPSRFSEVRNLIKDRLVLGCGKILINENVHSSSYQLKDIFTSSAKSEIIKASDILDDSGLKKVLDDIMMDLISHKNIRGQLVLDIVEEILQALTFSVKNRVSDPRCIEEGFSDLRKVLLHQSSIQSIFGVLTSTMIERIYEEKQIKKEKTSLPIIEVKKYINENFFMPLSLESVSSYIGMNPTYFSTLFKKETGVGFLEYLTNIRMEEAKELLGDPKRLISDTASEVGYKDTKHFTKQFKKIVGLSPIEYRKIYY